MTTYFETAQYLERELAQLRNYECHLYAGEIFQVLNNQPTRAADDACRCFARTQQWPPMPATVHLEVTFRLDGARLYCLALDALGAPFDTALSEELESVMIDYWQDVGREQWLYDAFLKGRPAFDHICR